MKKGILNLLLLLLVDYCHAAILKWDGEAGDGQWATSINWDLDRLPVPGDEVILDNAYISDDYTVFFPGGNNAVSLLSLIISPGSSQIITCILPSANTASPALILTGPGDVFVLNKGAVFRNASGAALGTPVTVTTSGFFRINNGGHYIHQTTRGHTDYLVSRLSDAAGTEEGIFEFDVPGTASYTISISNRVFGKLIFSASSSGSQRTYTGAGINPVTVRGGMEIRSNTVLSYGANTDSFHIGGDCLVQESGTFNIANGSNKAIIAIKGNLDNRGLITETGTSTGSGIVLNGISRQSILSTGDIAQEVKLTVNNPAGIRLLSPLLISYQLELIQGKLYTSSTDLLSLGADAICSGGSSLSFIEGPMKKIGNTGFDFPLGTGGIYAPIGIGNGGLNTDEFLAEYKRANPQSAPGLGNICQAPIHHISYVEYWNLLRTAGNSSRKIKLAVSSSSFAYNLPALVVARADNGQWISEGGNTHAAGMPSPPYATGTFISDADIEEFGSFTLGSTIDQTQNPLPIKIESFNVRFNNGQSFLQWKTGVCPAAGLRFEVQRAGHDQLFRQLMDVYGNDTGCVYQFTDNYPEKGENYYRLKLTEVNGEISFSKTIVVSDKREPVSELRLSGIERDLLKVSVYSTPGNISFFIFDVSGRVVRSYNRRLFQPGEMFYLPLQELTKGRYLLAGVSGRERLNGICFLK
ncbi:MAG: hypothetical protein E6Q24_02700 [Chitinophagaceae bacterium]|nr:MAG: hypothetical protein E6Q24_02700 [Chitinophagaceae bacterium]